MPMPNIISDTQRDIDAVQAGKKTATTLFKNTGDVGNMANQVEGHEREIQATSMLLDLLTVYLVNYSFLLFQWQKYGLASTN